MKKRILALFLVMLTVFGAFSPMYSLPSMASEEKPADEQGTVTVPIYDMTVGKTYSAYFKRADDGSSPNVYIYNDGKATKAYETSVSTARFPDELTVVLERDGDSCVKVLNEDWPELAEDYRYVDYNDIVVVEPVETDEGYILGRVTLTGDSISNNRTTVRKGEKVDVLASAAEEIADGARYQWQVKIDEDRWAVITGYMYYYAILTRALLLTVATDGVAYVRCVVTSGTSKYVSRDLRVTLSEETVIPTDLEVDNNDTMTLATAPSYMADGDDANADVTSDHDGHDAFEVVISYTFRHINPASEEKLGPLNGEAAANTFTISLHENGYYSGTIASPAEVGYLPYVKVEQKNFVTPGTSSPEVFTYGGVDYVAANSIKFENVGVSTHVEVFYIPQFVNYTVKIYEQKLYDDNYTLADTIIYNDKRANCEIGEGLGKAREGFEALPYDHAAPISEDGTTVVEIYYDRLYYSLDYDLNDREESMGSANGATPSLVRYNTPVTLPRPSLKGYNFANWSLVSVKDYADNIVTNHSYSGTVSAGNTINVRNKLLYKANWALSKTIYTLVYWLEDADSTDSNNKAEYNVWYTHKITVTTGDYTIAGADNVKNYITTGNGFTSDQENDVTSTYPYLTYKANLTDTNMQKTVGDGTTTVDIYYARKEYNLKFYYAIEKTSNSKSTYHIIGGSTYYFGSNAASGDPRTKEIAAMRQYASGNHTSQTGQVTALPTLNAKGLARNYTLSYDEDGKNNYHYLTFKAKFGADISELWPCDVFNSAERTSANTHGQWSGKQAFVSAWNGEYRVRYTQDPTVNNHNQTIKGKYTVLDQNLLWNDNTITEDTVTYACFWENGANINWSVPELYRYNIYLPLLPEQLQDENLLATLTLREYNGTQYYLADRYNTVDDSTTAAQTQPGLVGFRAYGRSSATIPRSEYDTSLYREAYDMFYFYSRNIYHLTFNDMHGNTVLLTVPYDTYIGNHSEEEHAPEYPSDFEEGEAKFENWYYDESLTILFDHHAKMPAKNIQLYAKWEILSYTVTVYYDTAKTYLAYTEKYKFGDYANEPRHEDFQKAHEAEYKNLIFNGWYIDEDTRFDFNTMMVKGDMVLYAKWTSKVFVPYYIYYVIEDGNGGYIPVAEPDDNNTALAGVTKYFTPKVGDQLYEKYQTGCFPEMRSHSMTMKLNETNEYYFVYSHANTIRYQVTHYFEDDIFEQYIGNKVLEILFDHSISGEAIRASAATVDASFRGGISKDTIINAVQAKYNEFLIQQNKEPKSLGTTDKEKIWNAVKLMSPDYYVRPILLTTLEDNATKFHWEKRGETATYQVVYYYENLDGEFVPDTGKITYNELAIGQSVSVSAPTENGFTPEKEVVTGVVTGITVNNDGTFEPGLILKVRYKRNVYNYTIYHYADNSLTELKMVTGTAPFGTEIKITDVAEDIPGYVFIPPEEGKEVVTIASEGMRIICNYNARKVYYRYQITGTKGATLTVIADDNTAVGASPQPTTLSLINDGYFVNRWYYVVDGTEYSILHDDPEGWLSQDGMTVSPTAAPVEWAGKTIYIYAEVLPTTRRFSVAGDVANNKEQAFIFNIKSVQKGQASVNVTFVIFGNDYVDLAMLPHGEYIITVTGWAWRYGIPTLTYNGQTYHSTNGEFNITFDEAGPVVFTYTEAPNDKWFSDDLAGYLHFTTPKINDEEDE